MVSDTHAGARHMIRPYLNDRQQNDTLISSTILVRWINFYQRRGGSTVEVSEIDYGKVHLLERKCLGYDLYDTTFGHGCCCPRIDRLTFKAFSSHGRVTIPCSCNVAHTDLCP